MTTDPYADMLRDVPHTDAPLTTPAMLAAPPEMRMAPLVATAGITALMATSKDATVFIGECLAKFRRRDWGVVAKDDAKMNDAALKTGARILAAYPTPLHAAYRDEQVWIVADAANDRGLRTVTILYPSEY